MLGGWGLSPVKSSRVDSFSSFVLASSCPPPTEIHMALEIVEIQDVIDRPFEEVQEESPGMAEMAGMLEMAETCETPEICGTTEIAETFGITETAEVCVMLGT